MEELSPDELDAVLRTPQPRARRSKKLDRSHRTWFYGVPTELGQCDNPHCTDNRKMSLVYTWTHPSGQRMCRFCFMGGWLENADQDN